jgi:peroxiredoxin
MKTKLFFGFILLSMLGVAQNQITGTFPALSNQQVKLIGFNGFDIYTVDSTQAGEKGELDLVFSKNDYGIGYLLSDAGNSFIVILDENENLKLRGENFASPEKIEITEGKQNRLFEQYASEHPRREQSLSAWDYLAKIYKKDSLFAVHKRPKQAIATEKQRIKAEDSLFLANLPENSYVSYYLPLRKLVSSVSTIAQYRTEEIPATIKAFRDLDYNNIRLYKSGLLEETIESHFWLIENSGRSLDSVYIEMNKSIDIIVENLLTNEQKLNEITAFLFKLLEKRSLFESSEYLALKLLNEQACTLNDDFSAQLESYRAMKKGNKAPDFTFTGDVLNRSNTAIKKLSDIKSDYIVVVFGASWCPACPSELSQVAGMYDKWKSQNVEVVFVSLDTSEENFKSFTEPFPYISICDYKKWESPVVKAYHVFATPSIYLLDDDLEIVLKPKSIKQMDNWVDWNLVQEKN